MIEYLYMLTGSDLENALWNVSLSIHEYESKKQEQFICYLLNHCDDIAPSIVLRTLTNMLHWYYYNMNDELKSLYIGMLLSLNNRTGITSGDLFEIIGIVIKGCTQADYLNIVSFIKNNYTKCLRDYTSIISLCNCIRYAYPELNLEDKNIVFNILITLKHDFQLTDIYPSIELTINSLEDKNV